jgi:hypothetical protein
MQFDSTLLLVTKTCKRENNFSPQPCFSPLLNSTFRFIRGRIDANDDLQDILEYDDLFKEHIIADVLEKSAGQWVKPQASTLPRN